MCRGIKLRELRPPLCWLLEWPLHIHGFEDSMFYIICLIQKSWIWLVGFCCSAHTCIIEFLWCPYQVIGYVLSGFETNVCLLPPFHCGVSLYQLDQFGMIRPSKHSVEALCHATATVLEVMCQVTSWWYLVFLGLSCQRSNKDQLLCNSRSFPQKLVAAFHTWICTGGEVW